MTASHSGTRALTENGFEYLTDWVLREDRHKPADTAWDTSAGWIYAFVTESRVRYVGITTMVLRSRLDHYSYQLNDRVGELVHNALRMGERCRIFGLRRPGVDRIELELEEKVLIGRLETDWNVQR